MKIYPPNITAFSEETRIQSLIEYSGKEKVLWYSVPKKFEQYIASGTLDGFLIGLLPIAMQLGENIEVKGPVSEKLFFNLRNSIVNILHKTHSGLAKIEITAKEFDKGYDVKPKGFVASGFSGGVDSFCTLYDHHFNEKISDYKITHLILNNVGSHHDFNHDTGRKIFNARYNLFSAYIESLGLEYIAIDSNLAEFYDRPFIETHVIRNISAVLILQKLFSKFYYSSSYKYGDCSFVRNNDVSRVEPVIVPLLSTETLECISTGSEYTRVEKTLRMSKVPDANKWLNVCLYPNPQDGQNCSICHKCCRTLLTLELLGILYDFKTVFNIEKWKRMREGYIIQGLGTKKDVYMNELKDYAIETGQNFKATQIVASNFKFLDLYYRYFPKELKKVIRALKR